MNPFKLGLKLGFGLVIGVLSPRPGGRRAAGAARRGPGPSRRGHHRGRPRSETVSFQTRAQAFWGSLTRSGGPAGYGAGTAWTGGSLYADAFGAKRGPSTTQLVESFKSIAFACTEYNVGPLSELPLKLYAASGPGRPRPRRLCEPRDVTPSEFRRLGNLPYVRRAISFGVDDVQEITNYELTKTLDHACVDPETGFSYFDRPTWIATLCRYVDVVGMSWFKPEVKEGGRLEDLVTAGVLPTHLWLLQSQYVRPIRTGFDGADPGDRLLHRDLPAAGRDDVPAAARPPRPLRLRLLGDAGGLAVPAARGQVDLDVGPVAGHGGASQRRALARRHQHAARGRRARPPGRRDEHLARPRPGRPDGGVQRADAAAADQLPGLRPGRAPRQQLSARAHRQLLRGAGGLLHEGHQHGEPAGGPHPARGRRDHPPGDDDRLGPDPARAAVRRPALLRLQQRRAGGRGAEGQDPRHEGQGRVVHRQRGQRRRARHAQALAREALDLEHAPDARHGGGEARERAQGGRDEGQAAGPGRRRQGPAEAHPRRAPSCVGRRRCCRKLEREMDS